MNCSCTIEPWIRGLLTGYGLNGMLAALSLWFVWLALRKARREHFNDATPLARAVLLNYPALLLWALAFLTIAPLIRAAL